MSWRFFGRAGMPGNWTPSVARGYSLHELASEGVLRLFPTRCHNLRMGYIPALNKSTSHYTQNNLLVQRTIKNSGISVK